MKRFPDNLLISIMHTIRFFPCRLIIMAIMAPFVMNSTCGYSSETAEYPFLAKREAHWDTLSKKIVPEIIKNNTDIGSMMRYLEKAECTITANYISKIAGKQDAGSFSYAWNDKNKDGILAYGEITVTPRTSGTLSLSNDKIANDLKEQIYLSVFNLFSITDVSAKKTDDGCLMKLIFTDKMATLNAGINESQIKVSDDFRIIEWQTKLPIQSNTIKKQLTHKKWQKIWLLAGMSLSTPMPDGNIIKEEWKYSYSLEGKFPMPASIEVKTTYVIEGAVNEIRTQLEYKNWKIKKRTFPLPIVAAEKPGEDKGWEPDDEEIKDLKDLEDTKDGNIWDDENWEETPK